MFLKNIMSKILKNKGGLSVRGVGLSVGNRNDILDNIQMWVYSRPYFRNFTFKIGEIIFLNNPSSHLI